MVSLSPFLGTLLTRVPKNPSKEKLDILVAETLKESAGKSSVENRKSQWEYLLKNEIFDLAATEGAALKDEETTYYDELRDRLDLVLTFTEHDACEQTFPFTVLQDLLETQTISSCSHIFTFIESRSARLTRGMIPQKGKALILLRTLNDLLRRLSKMGGTTIFCGRILTFLSGVFPLGERSGVNLRGEYGPKWEGVGTKTVVDKKEEEVRKDAEMDVVAADDATVETDKMEVDSTDTEANKANEMYKTFWSLQLPFSFPPSFALPNTFPEFQSAVEKVLPMIKEATARERAMMGSNANAVPVPSVITPLDKKRKRQDGDNEDEDETTSDYFFAKFLTSPDLLELEIADTHFRRQILFQLLILLHHLLTFTKSAKAAWTTPRNRSLQMEFTLDAPPDDPSSSSGKPSKDPSTPSAATSKLPHNTTVDGTSTPMITSTTNTTTTPQVDRVHWVQTTIHRATEELRQTAPNGRAFAETVNVILEREKNWVRWKNELCAPFEREGWGEWILDDSDASSTSPSTSTTAPTDGKDGKASEGGTEKKKRKLNMEEATRGAREKMREPPKEWEHRLGTQALSEIWEMGYRELSDLENGFTAGDVKDFIKKIQFEDTRINRRKQVLRQARPRAPPPAVAISPTTAPASSDGEPMVVDPPAISVGSESPVLVRTNSQMHHSLPAKPSGSGDDAATVTSVPVTVPSAPEVPAPPVVALAALADKTESDDPAINKYNESKQRWAWLALRTARDQYLQHFGKIGTGDIQLLAQEIEKEKERAVSLAKEKEAKEKLDRENKEKEKSSVGVVGPEDGDKPKVAVDTSVAGGSVQMEVTSGVGSPMNVVAPTPASTD